MDYRSRIGDEGGFRCMKCRHELTWQENIDAPHNDEWRARLALFHVDIAVEIGIACYLRREVHERFAKMMETIK